MKKATYTAAELVPILEIENKTAKQEVIDELRERLPQEKDVGHTVYFREHIFRILDQLEHDLDSYKEEHDNIN